MKRADWLGEGKKLAYSAKGTIYTSLISKDKIEVEHISYTDNYPIKYAKSIKNEIEENFSFYIELTFLHLNMFLLENKDIGVTMLDLGFKSWDK